MKRKNAESISDILSRFFYEEGLQTPLNQYRLIHAWSDVVGKEIAKYTKNIYIKNQTLFIEISSPIIKKELSMKKRDLVLTLNNKVNSQVIIDIIFI